MSRFDYPVIDGVAASWADIALRVSPLGGSLVEIGDISNASSGRTVEVGEQREGGRVIQRTRGSVSYESSLTFYASGYRKLIRALMPLAPRDGNRVLVGLVHFNYTLMWTPPGSIDILERRFKGVRILGDTNDNSEGTDATMFEVPLSPLEIVDVIDGQEVALI